MGESSFLTHLLFVLETFILKEFQIYKEVARIVQKNSCISWTQIPQLLTLYYMCFTSLSLSLSLSLYIYICICIYRYTQTHMHIHIHICEYTCIYKQITIFETCRSKLKS